MKPQTLMTHLCRPLQVLAAGLAIALSLDNRLSILLGNGDGTFQSPRYLNVSAMPSFVTVADFNGDGIPDFIGGAEDGHFYYLRNPRSN